MRSQSVRDDHFPGPYSRRMAPWIPVVVSIVAAVGSMGAAFIAGQSAAKTRQAQTQAERVLELEKRLAASKAEMYEPMVELFRTLFDSVKTSRHLDPKKMTDTFSKFGNWIQIYGSDEAVGEFRKLMQSAYHRAPPEVLMRMYAQFVLAIRKDLGDPRTQVSLSDLLAIRINDVYTTFGGDLDVEEGAFLKARGWTPPWPTRAQLGADPPVT